MTTYYVSTQGNDNDDGDSPEHPWRTVRHTSSLFRAGFFQPGDHILLRRGDTWDVIDNADELNIAGSSGILGSPIKISAYGEGPRPCLNGQGSRRSPIEHRPEQADANHIIVESLEIANWQKGYNRFQNVHHWLIQDLYVHDATTDKWTCAIGVNDGSHHITIEDCIIERIQGEGIYCGRSEVDDGTHHVVIRNCTISNCEGEAVDMKDATHDIVVEDCEISFCGSGLPGRDSGQIGVGGHDNIIRRCSISGMLPNNKSAVHLGRYSGGKFTGSGYHNRVEECTIEGARGEFGAIRLRGHNNEIINNTFIDCDPIISGSQSGHTIEGNVIDPDEPVPEPPIPPPTLQTVTIHYGGEAIILPLGEYDIVSR